jgi:hypothetical protein
MTQKDEIPEAMVLAAIDRAARHRERPQTPSWVVYEHLALPIRSGQARKVRRALDTLTASKVLERSRRHSVDGWSLTRTGQRRLRTAQASPEPPVLPESPQHATWRSARTLAGQEIDRFRAETEATLGEALQTVILNSPVNSDVLFEFADQLRFQLRRLGSANYCFHEWAEPTEDHADIDRHVDPSDAGRDKAEMARLRALRRGRRDTSIWATEQGVQ